MTHTEVEQYLLNHAHEFELTGSHAMIDEQENNMLRRGSVPYDIDYIVSTKFHPHLKGHEGRYVIEKLKSTYDFKVLPHHDYMVWSMATNQIKMALQYLSDLKNQGVELNEDDARLFTDREFFIKHFKQLLRLFDKSLLDEDIESYE